MNHHMLSGAFVPLKLADRSLAYKTLAVLIGTVFLAVSSWIEVPMYPVPVTMQTFVVTMVGALYGWRLGGLTVMAWLAEALIGFPVLAGGAGGLAHFAGPTAGYLFAFPVVAAFVGFLAERGLTRNPFVSFAVMLLGNVLCLALGASWLANMIGFEKAWTFGVAPFIIGGVLKSALAAATIELLRRSGIMVRLS
ncbi:biotin transporter BioY [Phyllobacterium brassicacearum]|uniref:Biotin transporter n=1 Tax=Phyllobacterium brassicacearum TaxID=314235 RepID=A0A2P7BS12_9HYPH|nr:biotin transporter BioY [Phyllobacterium brassicacearum]PSH69241.1 biotin transporter BioY [Phyllobacterium brassicacearum]TDQ25338.1 biotin transport system substrate-specific component [Phyllobacterium brassicacearum]